MKQAGWMMSIIMIGAVLLSGCSSRTGSDSLRPVVVNRVKARHLPPVQMRQLLMKQYLQWKGTPYAWGGLTTKGIDCSGLVYLTFLNRLGIQLPRTTAELALIGTYVPFPTLAPGDLVFFKTGLWSRHVGLYLGQHQFLHASSSRGVRLSQLNNPYWQAHYWQGRRVIFPQL